MEFLTDAIHSPAAAARTPFWDGRDDDADDDDQLFDGEIEQDDVLNNIASRDEEDEAGNIEVIMQQKKTPSNRSQDGVGKLAVKLMNKSRHSNKDDEPVSPHVPVEDHVERAKTTKQYGRALRNHDEHHPPPHGLVVASNRLQAPTTPITSPHSTNNSNNNNNSLLLNLFDLEHSLNDETSTLKDLMIKMKSERDQLRHDKSSLKKQLAYHQMLMEAEEKRHENEASRHTMELTMVKSQWASEVQSLQNKLEEVQLQYVHECNQMAQQNKTTLDLLALETSAERQKLMDELEEARHQIQHLGKTNDETQVKLTQLSEELVGHHVTIESLLEEKRCFELYEEESKTEIQRLKKRLEETTGDILRFFESNDDNSERSGDEDEKAPCTIVGSIITNHGGCSTSVSMKEATTMLTLPNLCDMDINTETVMSPATTSSYEECDHTIDQCQYQREKLTTHVDALNARLETHAEESFPINKAMEDMKKLQFKLDVQVRVNELLSNELVLLHSGKSTENNPSRSADYESVTKSTDNKIVGQLQEQVQNLAQANEILSSELTTLRDKTTADAAVQVGKEIDEVKLEHQIEIKLLKKELAETKTMVKLLAKEYDSLTDAYAVEQKSNNELERSLEEVVHLLMSERVEVHDGHVTKTKGSKRRPNK